MPLSVHGLALLPAHTRGWCSPHGPPTHCCLVTFACFALPLPMSRSTLKAACAKCTPSTSLANAAAGCGPEADGTFDSCLHTYERQTGKAERQLPFPLLPSPHTAPTLVHSCPEETPTLRWHGVSSCAHVIFMNATKGRESSFVPLTRSTLKLVPRCPRQPRVIRNARFTRLDRVHTQVRRRPPVRPLRHQGRHHHVCQHSTRTAPSLCNGEKQHIENRCKC